MGKTTANTKTTETRMADQKTTPVDTTDFDAPEELKVRCVVHTRPWTHEKALEHDEEATVPAHVAELMLKKGHVRLA